MNISVFGFFSSRSSSPAPPSVPTLQQVCNVGNTVAVTPGGTAIAITGVDLLNKIVLANSANNAGFIGLKNSADTFTIVADANSGSITATSFIKTGGTSAQFLKADGSVDNNTYLTTTTASTTYFPLVGGSITGIGGNGFIGYIAQSSAPSVPANGFRLYANSSNAFSWIGANGFTRTFDGTTNTANRTYTLPDASGTFALLSVANVFSVNQTINASLGLNTSSPTHTITLASTSTGTTFYNTIDQTTNFERGRIFWGANIFTIGTTFAGTGTTPRGIRIFTEAVAGGIQRQFDITPTNTLVGSSHFLFNNTATTQIGNLFGLYGSFTATSGQQASFAILNTVNQTTTASYRSIWVSPFIQTSGSSILLLDAGTNSAASGAGTHTSVFNVNSIGKLSIITGTNYSVGTATLVSGTITINNTAVTANSLIFIQLINVNTSTAIGSYRYTIVAGTSFTITSIKQNNATTTETADVSTVQYWIIN